MKSLFILIAACNSSVDIPSVPDGTYAVTDTTLAPKAVDAYQDVAVHQDGQGYNQLGSDLGSVMDQLGVTPITVSTSAQFTISKDLVTLAGAHNVATPFDFQTDHLHVDAGSTTIQITLPNTPPIELDLDHASLWLDPDTLTGAFGGAITQQQVIDRLMPPFVADLNAIVTRDCPAAPPTCGCAMGSFGAEIIGLFVTKQDRCAVTIDDVMTNGFTASLLAPDLAPAYLTIGMSAALR